MKYQSNYPPALLVRVPSPHENRLSGVLVARSRAYLAIKILFHGIPQEGIEVRFFESNNGDRGPAIGDPAKSGVDGIVRLDRLVPASLYYCEIENHGWLLVPTVSDFEETISVVLPLNRPHLEANDGHELEDAGEP